MISVSHVIKAAPARLTRRRIYCWIHSRFRKIRTNGYHFRLTPGQALELLIVAELRRKGVRPGIIRRWQLAPPPEADCLVVFCAKPRYAWLDREQAIRQATKAKCGVLLVSVADLRARLLTLNRESMPVLSSDKIGKRSDGVVKPAASRRRLAGPPRYRRIKGGPSYPLGQERSRARLVNAAAD
jgi:hypothetical protein